MPSQAQASNLTECIEARSSSATRTSKRLGGDGLGIVLLGVRLGGVTGMLRSVELMGVRDVRVMRRCFVRPRIMVLRRLLMMMRRLFVMVRRFSVIVGEFL